MICGSSRQTLLRLDFSRALFSRRLTTETLKRTEKQIKAVQQSAATYLKAK